MWDELNLKNLLHDAKIMDMENLSKRYQLSFSCISALLKRYGVTPKHPYGHSRKHKTTGNTLHPIDEPLVTARPRYPKYSFYTINQVWG